MHSIIDVNKISPKQNVLIILCLGIAITAGIASNITFGLATPENKTLMEPQGVHGMSNTNNVTNIVLVHGGWADGSGWSTFAPDEGQSLSTFVNPANFPKELFMPDSGGFIYLNPEIFRENFAQDVDPAEADIMAIVQKPFNQLNFAANSGSPAWKQLRTWYQISESDKMIPPDVQHTFAEKTNATTLSLNSSHSSYVSYPTEIANFILNATKGK